MEAVDPNIARIHEVLKRCTPETVEAAIRFRTKGDLHALPIVVLGIIRRYLPPETRDKAADLEKNDHLRLMQDLGLDSLTLLEVVLAIEESLGISQIDNEELRRLQTIGDVKQFIEQKVSSGSGRSRTATQENKSYHSKEQILCILPQQPPFLFVDSAEVDNDQVRARYRVTGEEYFLQGHFKGNPVFPASILFEALGQAGCLWALTHSNILSGQTGLSHDTVFSSMGEAHFHRKVSPGESIELELKVARQHYPLVVFNGNAKVDGKCVASVESLELMLIPKDATNVR
jgi:3-hydroxyacyl-[acyl-carrier-protein] dehydratase